MNISIVLINEQKDNHEPSPYFKVDGRPVYAYSIQTFFECPKIDKIILVSDKTNYEPIQRYLNKNNLDTKTEVCIGGETKNESIINAIRYLGDKLTDDDIISIHDSLRPLVSREIIEDNINKSRNYGCSITIIKNSNIQIKANDNRKIETVMDNKNRYDIQSPLSMRIDILNKIIPLLDKQDILNILLKQNYSPVLVKGNPFNFKIDTPENLALFMYLVGKR